MRTSKVAALVVVSGKPSAARLKKQRIMSAAAAHLACVVWADDAAVIQLFACIKSEISLPWKAPEQAVGQTIEFRFTKLH